MIVHFIQKGFQSVINFYAFFKYFFIEKSCIAVSRSLFYDLLYLIFKIFILSYKN